MSVAVTFRAHAENERRKNKNHHAFFGRSEEKPLPDTIELKTPASFI
jgi:hypothetical protein